MDQRGLRPRLLSRRRLLGATLGLAGFGGAAKAEQVVRLGLAQKPLSPGGAAARAFAETLRQLSAGSYAIEVYDSGALGTEAELIEAVRLGGVPLALVSLQALVSAAPPLGVLAIPFLFRSVEAARRAMDGPEGADCLALAGAAGVVPVGWSEDGVHHLTSATAPVRCPADMRGMRLPVPPVDSEILGFRALGADVSVVAPEAVFAALQGRRMDGQESTLAAMLDAELWRVQACLSLTAHVYAPALLIAGQSFWDGVPADSQVLFRQAAQAGAQAARACNDETDSAAIEQLRRLGMTVIEDIDRSAFTTASESAAAPLARLYGGERIAALRAVG